MDEMMTEKKTLIEGYEKDLKTTEEGEKKHTEL